MMMMMIDDDAEDFISIVWHVNLPRGPQIKENMLL